MKRRTTLIALVSSLAVLLTVLLTGCGTAAYSDTAAPELQNHEVQSDLSQSNQTDPAAATPQTPSYITPDEAKEIALNHAGVSAADARWDDREFDLENGKTIYELSFDANGLEYEYDIDARIGEVLKAHSERDDDRSAASSSATQNTTSGKPAASDKSASSGSDYIGLEKAKSIALQKAGVSASSVRWEQAEFDYDDGRPIYELDFDANGLEYEYDIDARTGEVLKAHSERDDDRSAASSSATQNTTSGKPAASDKSASSGSDYIGLEKAKSIALQKAGVSASSVRWEKARLDYDDGRAVYELEFRSGSTEYDCEVHAVSGKILDYDAERDDHDDHDDHDHDDRWDD